MDINTFAVEYGIVIITNVINQKIIIETITNYFWIVLIIIFFLRFIVLLGGKNIGDYMGLKGIFNKIGKSESTHYDNFRSHNITLASFSMTVLAIIIAFPSDVKINENTNSLFYLSLALICFFVSSYLFLLRDNRWYPFIGESLEYTGIVSIGIGLFGLITNVTSSPQLLLVYFIFLIAMLILVFIQLRIVIKVFHQ